jgi:hypothetical protein
MESVEDFFALDGAAAETSVAGHPRPGPYVLATGEAAITACASCTACTGRARAACSRRRGSAAACASPTSAAAWAW